MANVITTIRIICAISLIFSPTFSKCFYALYILGGISDVFDGIVARHFGKETKLGAQLDTVADIIFTIIAMVKVVRVIHIPIWLIVWIILIAVIKTVNIFSGFVIYKRFVSEHTVINKICGVLLFLTLFFSGWISGKLIVILAILTCGVGTFAAGLECYYILIGKEIS